jgi:hypothetical protein
MDAVEKSHRGYFDEAIRSSFADSLELDEAMHADHDQENRWDYLLGHSPSDEVIAVEPHSAKQGQITTVIRKRAAARAQLAEHLRDGARISRWLWVASGKVHFADTEKAKRELDQNGIEFVGTKVLAKHLSMASSTDRTTVRRGRRRKSKK